MNTPTYHLAQLNIARARASLDDPLMADFVAQLDAINAVADQSPGFVWRLQDDAGNATSIHPLEDDRIIVNLSVWESVEALRAYVYRSDHQSVLRRRKEWFTRMDGPYLVLWWIPAGHIPTVEEAKTRLDLLHRHGPMPEAFGFKKLFPAPAVVPSSA